MKPVLLHRTDDQPILNSIISCLTSIECSEHFSEHIGKSQMKQKLIVSKFQNIIKSELEQAIKGITWSVEHRPTRTNRDSIDIYGKGHDFSVVIELDKNRADQVAKKFVSRIAILPQTTVYFISLCYPGTKSMNKSECSKYFEYCAILARRMNNQYAGLIIE